jgi:NADPH:quinone reductase-like Zn-dependent oxidoreductase
MKAIVYHRYGSPDVLQCEEIEKPTAGDAEILIRVRAAAINPLDWHSIRGVLRMMGSGLRKPNDPRVGFDVSGQVEAVGRNVTQFKPGDEVFGTCRGALAEYACAKEDRLVAKPANLSFEEAAAVPVAGVTALLGLRDKGGIQPGHKVLVDGASGGVGTCAVQIAKSFGADVTAVCSTRKMETARSIGADHVIDYTREDCTRSGQRYDLILGANAYHSVFDYRRALRPGGVYVMVGGRVAHMLLVMLLGRLLSRPEGKKMRFLFAKPTKTHLVLLAELLEAGRIVPVIDRRYRLTDAAEAIRYLATGHARGKVVITME